MGARSPGPDPDSGLGWRRADRGQSVVIGSVLMFGIVVLLVLVLQATAVPIWNQGVEFSHSQRVQDDLEGVRDSVLLTAATGRTTSTSVALGTVYPTRPFLINPAPPSGSLRTLEPQPLTITNATASGETSDYWDGSTRRFTNRHLTYTPDYNEYGNPPTTGYGNSLLYSRQGGRTFAVTSESFVDGRRINVVSLNGSYSASGTRTSSVQIQPLSTSGQVTSVRSDGPMEITAATALPEAEWEELLADERADEGGYVTDVSVTRDTPLNTLRVTLAADQTYNLRMAKVGVGTRLARLSAHYLTTESPPEVRVPTGASDLVVFEVRDRYNNPISGVRVNGSLSGVGSLAPVEPVTDADGHAAFRYGATSNGSATVTATFGDVPDGMQTANVSVEAVTLGAGGDGSPLSLEWTAPSTGETDTATFDVGAAGTSTLDLTATSSPAVEGLDVQYVVSDSSVGTVDPSGTTDPAGMATTTFTADSDGTVEIYATGGGDADVLTLTVTNLTATNDPPTIDALTITDRSKPNGNPKYVEFAVDYEVSDDAALQEIRFEAVRTSDGAVIDTNRTALSGTSASGSATLRGPDQSSNVDGDYDVTVTVVDGDGTRTAETRTVTVG